MKKAETVSAGVPAGDRRAGAIPPEALAREFEPSASAIRKWVAGRSEGHRSDGLTTFERQELRQLKRLRMERDILKKAVGSPGRATRSPERIRVKAHRAQFPIRVKWVLRLVETSALESSSPGPGASGKDRADLEREPESLRSASSACRTLEGNGRARSVSVD